MSTYDELEIGLHRLDEGTYQIELRYTRADSAGETTPQRGQAQFDCPALLELLEDPQAYGEMLAEQLFKDAAIRLEYLRVKTAVEARNKLLRLRLLVGRSAEELHALRWELLHDPETKSALATSERVIFSRFMTSQDLRDIELRSRASLHALVAVAAPSDLTEYGMADVDCDGEVARARANLAGIHVDVLGQSEPLTLDRLVAAVRTNVDVLYLVCHGNLPKTKEPQLYLQRPDGSTDVVAGARLAERLKELPQPPRLMVLASCHSAGTGKASAAPNSLAFRAALAPRLADAGVPAIVAMQGRISMNTVEKAMPLFFSELLKDGQIDRAMAVARGAVRDERDCWVPALFLRLRGGRLWYEGFGEGEKDFEKWDAILASIKERRVTPILGSGCVEHLYGDSRSTARRLATEAKFALSPQQRDDLPQVSQYYRVKQDVKTLRSTLKKLHRQAIRERHPTAVAELKEDAGLSKHVEAAVESLWRDEKYAEPHRVLASLPCRMYITTNQDDLLSLALKRADKDPQELVCKFRDKTAVAEPESPTIKRPLVFHMLGQFKDDDSLVLTQDDYFDFLIGVSREKHIPMKVDAATVQSSVLFLGFDINDWSFRVLFRRLKSLGGQDLLADNTHLMVQIEPDEQGNIAPEQARRYLSEYFTDQRLSKMSIFWGTARDFLRELHRRLQGVTLPSDEDSGNDY